jgi:small subunit ribosomal protein S17
MPKRILQGTVVGDKNKNTLVVDVKRRWAHPLYKKIVNSSKKYQVHNEGGDYKIGDEVEIIESRPYSKTKHFIVLNKIKDKAA